MSRQHAGGLLTPGLPGSADGTGSDSWNQGTNKDDYLQQGTDVVRGPLRVGRASLTCPAPGPEGSQLGHPHQVWGQGHRSSILWRSWLLKWEGGGQGLESGKPGAQAIPLWPRLPCLYSRQAVSCPLASSG